MLPYCCYTATDDCDLLAGRASDPGPLRRAAGGAHPRPDDSSQHEHRACARRVHRGRDPRTADAFRGICLFLVG